MQAISIERIDHLVLTVQDIPRTCAFYCDVLGMERVTFGEGRVALAFGNQKINVHQAGREFEPKAQHPIPGSVDVCLLTPLPLDRVIAHLAAHNVPLELGPVYRTGARGLIRSVYVRDPDRNVIEIANEVKEFDDG